jgi:hypothetical protein
MPEAVEENVSLRPLGPHDAWSARTRERFKGRLQSLDSGIA